MLAKKKVNTKDWRELPIDKWNCTTFEHFMYDLHQERFKLQYQTNMKVAERKQITNLRKEYGNEVVKEFIYLCFKNERIPKGKSALSFMVCLAWFKDKYLNKAIQMVEHRNKMEAVQQKQPKQITEDSGNEMWF